MFFFSFFFGGGKSIECGIGKTLGMGKYIGSTESSGLPGKLEFCKRSIIIIDITGALRTKRVHGVGKYNYWPGYVCQTEAFWEATLVRYMDLFLMGRGATRDTTAQQNLCIRQGLCERAKLARYL
jgi:hypothetical protein